MKSLLPLLKAISENKTTLNIESISPELFQFAIDSGLASYLKHCSEDSINNEKSKYNTTLNSADLTAKILTHTQLDALDELIRIAASEVDEVILLKGISICQKLYPLPHIRIMSDIDLLVSEKDSKTLEGILIDTGYKQISENSVEFYDQHHHSMPFYNAKNNVWLEIHTHLFSGSNPNLDDELFKIDSIFKNTVIINKEKYPINVKQLSTEYQLIYTCSHWVDDLKIHKSSMQLIDMILLIKNNGAGLDWTKIFAYINNTSSASYVFLLLSYFDKYKIIDVPKNYANLIKLKNSNMGIINMSILHYIVDGFLLGKIINHKFLNENNIQIIWSSLLLPSSSLKNLTRLPLNLLFPPKNTNRYKFKLFISRIKNMTKY